MFLIVRFSAIYLILSLYINFSNANEVYIEEYKNNQYPEYTQDFVIELPVYEPIRDHSLQNNIVPQTYVPLYFNEDETTTISSIFHNIQNEYEEPIMEASNLEHYQEYIKMETSQPVQITTEASMITSTTKVNDLADSIVSSHTEDHEANELINELKIKYNKKSFDKKNFQLKSQQLKPLNKKREISKQTDQENQNYFNKRKLSHSKNQFQYTKEDNITNGTIDQKNFEQIKKMKGRSRKRKNQQKPKVFTGFGHTFKTLNRFLNVDKFFTDILKPIGRNLDEIENKSNEPIKTNLYTLIAKATSLKNNDNNNNGNNIIKKSDFKKPISRKLNKRSNVKRNKIETESNIPIEKQHKNLEGVQDDHLIEEKTLVREKRQQQLRKGVKNFKLTMQMLSNIDKYVSSMLKTYFEKLSNYIDNEDGDDDDTDDNDNDDKDEDN